MTSHSLIEDLKDKSFDFGFDHRPVLKEIDSRVPLESVKAYYISAGPMPEFPTTKLEVSLLTDAFIYNYELTVDDNEQWFTLPLTSVSYIVETHSPSNKEFWSLIIAIHSSVGKQGGLVLQDEMANRDKIREFANACREMLSAVIAVHQSTSG